MAQLRSALWRDIVRRFGASRFCYTSNDKRTPRTRLGVAQDLVHRRVAVENCAHAVFAHGAHAELAGLLADDERGGALVDQLAKIWGQTLRNAHLKRVSCSSPSDTPTRHTIEKMALLKEAISSIVFGLESICRSGSFHIDIWL